MNPLKSGPVLVRKDRADVCLLWILEKLEETAMRSSSQYPFKYRSHSYLLRRSSVQKFLGFEMAMMGRYLKNHMSVGSKEKW